MVALGGRRKLVSRVFVFEYLLLGLMGGLVGFVFAALGVTALVRGVFEFDVELSWLIALGTAGLIGLTSGALGTWVARNLVLRGLR
jgi:predicted lysophospholipase L1 biosynthesis ABC-type transport system permease subunit